MTFPELLKLLSTGTNLDLGTAAKSGGCTIQFDKNIDVTFENHDNNLYLFSPVMNITSVLSEDFFASLLQIQLFGIATNRCWFGYDAGGQRVLLFCLFDLNKMTPEDAIERIEVLVDQVQYWQQNLPQIAKLSDTHSGAYRVNDSFQRPR
ncbi:MULTISPECIES: type III secretion system chaperone [Yersinia]|uniref:type III secretion system chaperone n=1 Tax=Yersinia TaxID=629 RepID=UPI0013CDF9B2|nr:type III secretion system chaperone [Yersinia sp. IP36721]